MSENKADMESDNILNGIINNMTFLSISSMCAFHFVCKIAAKDWRTGQNEDENCYYILMTSLIYIVEAEYCKLLNVRVPNQVGVSDHLQPILPYFHYKK